MELRMYLDILRRRWKLIAAATVIVAVVAGVTSSLKTPVYTASAQVLLRPGDASEQLTQTDQVNRGVADADRYVTGQLDIVESAAVAKAAAVQVKGTTAKELLEQVTASQAGATDIVKISVADADPARAARIANAFADAYIENRKATAVAGLEKAASEIETKLSELETRIGDGFVPTEGQALSAARSAAVLQYQTLYAQQQTLLVNKTLKKGEAELITTAEAPTAPSTPKPKRDGALGAIVGLLLGLGIAFLREQLDDRVRGRADAEELTKLPVIAELPLDQVKSETEIAAHERPQGNLAEAARSLRTSINFLGVDEPVRRIVVTSAEPGDGKSFVAANLAAVYAQAGMRTVLVSADLRRPTLDTMFPSVAAGPGLAEVIAMIGAPAPSMNGHDGHTPSGPSTADTAQSILAKALRPTHIENLSLLPSGQLPPNPAEILGSARAQQMLEVLSGLADVIIIDTPPVLAVTDAVVLAPRTDGVVLVAAADRTHKHALTRSAGTLFSTHARLLGVVLNKVEHSGSSYYNGYGAYYGSFTAAEKTSRRPWRRSGEKSPTEVSV